MKFFDLDEQLVHERLNSLRYVPANIVVLRLDIMDIGLEVEAISPVQSKLAQTSNFLARKLIKESQQCNQSLLSNTKGSFVLPIEK